MLGLSEQVRRAQGRVGVPVGDHERLRRTVQPVDADLAEDELLGERREEAARPADHIDPGDRLGAVGHGSDGLRPSYLEDSIRSRYVGGYQYHRMDAPVDTGIRRDDDLVHARNPCGNDGHQHRGGEPGCSARNVYADALDRVYQLAVTLGEIYPARRPAFFLEPTDSLGGQTQSVDDLGVDRVIGILDSGRRYLQVTKLNAVEPPGMSRTASSPPSRTRSMMCRAVSRGVIALPNAALVLSRIEAGAESSPMPRPVSRAALDSSGPHTILISGAPRPLGPCRLWRHA